MKPMLFSTAAAPPLANIREHLVEANEWWVGKYHRSLRIWIRNHNHRVGKDQYCICIFGEPTYFSSENKAAFFASGNKEYLGIPPYCGWRVHKLRNN